MLRILCRRGQVLHPVWLQWWSVHISRAEVHSKFLQSGYCYCFAKQVFHWETWADGKQLESLGWQGLRSWLVWWWLASRCNLLPLVISQVKLAGRYAHIEWSPRCHCHSLSLGSGNRLTRRPGTVDHGFMCFPHSQGEMLESQCFLHFSSSKAFWKYHVVLRGPIQSWENSILCRRNDSFSITLGKNGNFHWSINFMSLWFGSILFQLCHEHAGSSSKVELVMETYGNILCLYWKLRAPFQRFSLVLPWDLSF